MQKSKNGRNEKKFLAEVVLLVPINHPSNFLPSLKNTLYKVDPNFFQSGNDVIVGTGYASSKHNWAKLDRKFQKFSAKFTLKKIIVSYQH